MLLHRLKSERSTAIISLIIGAFSFLYFVGPGVLNPLNIGWMLSGDPAQHLLGWLTYKDTPLLQLPFGLNYNYGAEISSSIVYTDSIPLIAMLLKPFAKFSNVDFQYAGLWLLMCFSLQSYVSYKLMLRLTDNRIYSLLFGALLSFAPIMLFRTQNHLSLCSHFLLITSIYLLISLASNYKWIALLCVSVMVHAYLLVMIFPVYICYLAYRLHSGESLFKQATKLLVALFFLFFFMWFSGYFVVSNGLGIGGYGIFRMDTLAMLNPGQDYMSNFMKPNNNQLTNLEGFNYFGFGVIISAFIACYAFFYNRDLFDTSIDKYKAFVLVVALLIYIFSVSNTVSILGHTVIDINIPRAIHKILDIFRANGRFFWIVYYALFSLIFYVIYKASKSKALPVLVLALLIQFIDLSGYKYYLDVKHINNIVNSKEFNSIPENIEYNKVNKIEMIPPSDFTSQNNEILYWGIKKNLPVNYGYLTRFDGNKVHEQEEAINQLIKTNGIKAGSLYIIGKSAVSMLSLCGEKNVTCVDTKFGKAMYLN